MARKLPWTTAIFALLLLAYAVYAGVFIYQSSLVINGQRYFSLFDDAMISMDYARTLAQGGGAVYYPGAERVEGYSNPLWVAYMALFHLLPIPQRLMALPIQITGAVCLLLNLLVVRKLGDWFAPQQPWVGLGAAFLTAFFYPLNQWSLLGNEVAPLTLLISWSVWVALRARAAGRVPRGLFVLLGLSTLLRMDMLAFGGLIVVWLAWFDRPRRWQHLAWGGGLLMAFMLLQSLARYAYYGDWLPNTYYLKMVGGPLLLRLKRGAFVFAKFAWNFNLVLFVLPLLWFAFRRDAASLLLAATFVLQAAYSIYVGGDAWEHRGGSNRFFSIAMPMYLLLFMLASELLRQGLLSFWRQQGGSRLRLAERLSLLSLVGFLLLSEINFNALLDTDSLRYAFLLKPTIYSIGQQKAIELGLFIKQVTTPQARVAVVIGGGLPYFSERPAIDLLGKADAVIARQPMHVPAGQALIDFRPGHNKWDYSRSLGELKPDVISEVFVGTNAEAEPYLKDYRRIQVPALKRWVPDGILYVRTDSPYILWDQVAPYLLP